MSPLYYRIDDELTGTCTCCENEAFMFGVEGKEGYVDACEEHAEVCLIDAGLLPADEE